MKTPTHNRTHGRIDSLPATLIFALVFPTWAANECVAYGDEAQPPPLTDLLLNEDATPFHSHPSAASTASGTLWVAWHAYRQGKDRIDVRRFAADGTRGDIETISDGDDVAGPPVVVRGVDDSIWVVWTVLRDGHWQVVARASSDGAWRAPVVVSDPACDAIFATAVHTEDGRLLVTWCGRDEDGFRIISRIRDRKQWHHPVFLSPQGVDAYRPVLAARPDGLVWAFWDQYKEGRYSVMGRRLLPKVGRIEQVSPQGTDCLKPAALATSGGVYVAWLNKRDVIGGPGVVSQWHTLQAAVLSDTAFVPAGSTGGPAQVPSHAAADDPARSWDGDRWRLITDKYGHSAAAQLTHGLMAQIEPKVVATGGYLGRRTQPMMLADGQTVWLLWERKSDHRASTPNVVGDLIGRPVEAGKWGRPSVLHHGLVDYHLTHPTHASGGRFFAVASQLPRQTRRIYHRIEVDLDDGEAFHQDDWEGWRPFELPVESEQTARHSIQVGEETYKLFWADMHCHSGLTCDAEGEPDELTHYARDRAQLDVVVFTNNDFLYDVPLTGYEYALSSLFARVYTRSSFLSLPGYEWTSRVPGVPDARLSDPRNWTPPYRNRSYPNHRSVIYPPSGGAIVRFPEVANNIERLNEAVQRAGGITLTQHDAFQTSGHPVEVAMELTSGWRNYIARVPRLFHEPLNQGARLGFVACGDSHRRAPGLSGALTGIYADELTSDAILDALRNRRCFATNGSRIFLDARAGGVPMGQEAQAADGSIELTLEAEGTRPIRSAVLIRDGVEIETFTGVGNRTLSASFNDTGLLHGTHWYYWRIAQKRDAPVLPGNLMAAHGHLAWSSPLWVRVP